MKLLSLCLLLSCLNATTINQSLIRFGSFSNFDATRNDKIAIVDSPEIYLNIAEYKIIQNEKVKKDTARYFSLMKTCTQKYKKALRACRKGYVLIVEKGGVTDYPTTDITLKVIAAL
tara:strand:+ start:301 stop:651 length:351 start_codon:yes stop_codon:yes gene_type:complete